MNAVEFFFALFAVTMMTTVIYVWTRFVYSMEAQREDEPPKRETARATRHDARDNEPVARLGVNASQQAQDQNAAVQ